MTNLSDFKKIIWEYYREHGRLFDWRHVDDPYKIVVSEIMLQQTQTNRVAQKYPIFIEAFANFDALAQATLKEVLFYWQGLGYNRRGMYTHKIAQEVMKNYGGILPDDPEILETFPGIGPNTARSICAFAFNKPVIFIETNIRAVFIYAFFQGKKEVHDKEILPLIEETLDHENPREWYYALMDYGSMLKKTIVNPSRKSAHYAKQSKFQGSDRQIRGAIIRKLTTENLDFIAIEQLKTEIAAESSRFNKVLQELIDEGFIKPHKSHISLAN